jgi:hypothetical protein
MFIIAIAIDYITLVVILNVNIIVRTLALASHSCPGLALSASDSFYVGDSILLGDGEQIGS